MSARLANQPCLGGIHPAVADQSDALSIADLAQAWARAKAAYDLAQKAFDHLESLAISRRPGRPNVWNMAQGRWEPHAGIGLELWEKACARIDQELGLEAADATATRALEAADRIAHQIQGIPPQTAWEAAIKFGVLLGRYGGPAGKIEDGAPFYAFLSDLEQIAQGGGCLASPPVSV